MSDSDDLRGSRRRFLQLAVIAPLAGCMPEEEVTPDEPPEPTPAGPGPISDDPVNAGSLEDYPVGTLAPVEGFRLVVGHDDDGVWAMSTQCTHLGCNIANRKTGGNIDFGGLECGCHGSLYDRDGNVDAGPSVRPLANYSVEIDGSGDIIVDMTEQVPIGTRTRVS